MAISNLLLFTGPIVEGPVENTGIGMLLETFLFFFNFFLCSYVPFFARTGRQKLKVVSDAFILIYRQVGLEDNHRKQEKI